MIDGFMGDAVSIRHCRVEENTGAFIFTADVKNRQLFMNNDLANAKGDGKTLDTIAIQSAIDTACAHGGGIVVVSKGVTSRAVYSSETVYNFNLQKMRFSNRNVESISAPKASALTRLSYTRKYITPFRTADPSAYQKMRMFCSRTKYTKGWGESKINMPYESPPLLSRTTILTHRSLTSILHFDSPEAGLAVVRIIR